MKKYIYVMIVTLAFVNPVIASKRLPVEAEVITLEQRGDKADVFYPVSDDRKYPVIAVLQGALVDKQHYSQIGEKLASYGYVVVIPNHLQFGQLFTDQFVINDVLAQMVIEDNNNDSPLSGKVDTENMGVIGHSAGGAAGLFALEGSCIPPFCFGFYDRPEALKVGAFYGTNTCFIGGDASSEHCVSFSNPGGMQYDVDITDPVVFIQGSKDGVSTPGEGRSTYELLDGFKRFVKITGANHYGITNVNNPEGASPDSSSPKVSQEKSINQIAKKINQNFKKFLKTSVGKKDCD